MRVDPWSGAGDTSTQQTCLGVCFFECGWDSCHMTFVSYHSGPQSNHQPYSDV